MEIKGLRVILRSYEEKDAVRISEIANNKNIAQNMVDTFPFPYSLENAKTWIEHVIGSEKNKSNFVIIFENEIVGGVGFGLKDGLYEGVASGGYWLGEDYWGKGIATEAWKMISDYAFKNFNIRRMEAGVFSWNIASAKVQEKCGFKKEGVKRSSVIRMGRVGDEIMYALTRKDWEVLNGKG